jgi:hypothetical protein
MTDELTPDKPPRCRLVDNRRARRDRDHGRSYLARCLRRGSSMPWHGAWPPVWAFDVVPVLHLRRARGAQSARWAAGVKVVSLTGSPEEQWTVSTGGVGPDAHDGAASGYVPPFANPPPAPRVLASQRRCHGITPARAP